MSLLHYLLLFRLINNINSDCSIPRLYQNPNGPNVNYWFGYSNVCGDAISLPKQNNPYVKYFGEYNSYIECQSACINSSSTNNQCQSFTFFESNTTNINNTNACYGRINDPQWCPCKSNSTISGEIYWACLNDMDCSLNGKCNLLNGLCECNKQWKGQRCQLLNLLPVPSNYTNGNEIGFIQVGSSSWGGSVLIDDKNDNKYHMFLSYFPHNCGHIADTMNSRVVHAISTNGYAGPYIYNKPIAEAWSHEPFATRGPNNEYVLYFSYTRNEPYWPQLCDCYNLNGNVSNGTTPEICCDITPNSCSYSQPSNLTRHTTVMVYTSDINNHSSWSNIQYLWASNETGPSNSDTNFVCKIFRNGSVLGFSRRHTSKGTNVLYFVTASKWNDPSTYIEHFNTSIFPQWAFRGNEDPFLYQDKNGYYHLLFHNEIPDPGHDQFFSGAHAASYNGYNWTYFGYAYDTNITFIDDKDSYQILYSRERPHLVFAKDGVTPLALVNGVLYKNNTYQNDRSFTFLQPINQD